MPLGVLSRRRAVRLAMLTPMALAVSACGRATTSTVIVAAASPVPTTAPIDTPTPSPAPAPSATPTMAATEAPTTQPTVAPTATAAPAATATVAPTSTPNPEATARAFTALQPGRGWDFGLRPLLFQVDNAPAARPQNGLSDAYVVYETPAEGEITRFSALIIQQKLATIGNLRSARLVDLDLAPQWDALLVHVGASTQVENMLITAGVNGVDFEDLATVGVWWRTAQRIAPYNLYTSLDRLRPYLSAHNMGQDATKPRSFPVGPIPSGAKATAATRITLPYDQPSDAVYIWDEGAKGYLRYNAGVPLIDANTGHQIVVSNVIVHYAVETVTNIIEDTGGSHSLQYRLQGTGRAVLWRDGQQMAVTWQRDGAGALTQYRLADGTPAPFAPGNVWIAIAADTGRSG